MADTQSLTAGRNGIKEIEVPHPNHALIFNFVYERFPKFRVLSKFLKALCCPEEGKTLDPETNKIFSIKYRGQNPNSSTKRLFHLDICNFSCK